MNTSVVSSPFTILESSVDMNTSVVSSTLALPESSVDVNSLVVSSSSAIPESIVAVDSSPFNNSSVAAGKASGEKDITKELMQQELFWDFSGIIEAWPDEG